jgi:hypothetical protein
MEITYTYSPSGQRISKTLDVVTIGYFLFFAASVKHFENVIILMEDGQYRLTIPNISTAIAC